MFDDKKIAVFLSTSKMRNGMSGPAMLEFANSIKSHGDEVVILDNVSNDMPEADMAVMFGYFSKTKSVLKGIQARRKLIHQKYSRTLCMDGGCFRSLGNNIYFRVGYDSPLWDGDFHTDRITAPVAKRRWDNMAAILGDYTGNDFTIQAWKKDGDYILVALQTSTGWSMDNGETEEWIEYKIDEIRAVTDMPILIRFHPSQPLSHIIFTEDLIAKYTNISTQNSNDMSAIESLTNAKALVTYNSSIACDAVLMGVPTFIDENRCFAAPACNTDINNLLNPYYPDRQAWLNIVAYTMWNLQELTDGTAWNHLR